jgi:hypothetical protein
MDKDLEHSLDISPRCLQAGYDRNFERLGRLRDRYRKGDGVCSGAPYLLSTFC